MKRAKKTEEDVEEPKQSKESSMLKKWRDQLIKARHMWQELIYHQVLDAMVDAARENLEEAEYQVDKRNLEMRKRCTQRNRWISVKSTAIQTSTIVCDVHKTRLIY